MIPASRRVLLVEDNDGDASLTRQWLAELATSAFYVDHVTTLRAALDRLASTRHDAVLVELHLPDSSGFETLRRIRAAAPETPIVVVAPFSGIHHRLALLREGAEDVIAKDEPPGLLFSRSIVHAIERSKMRERQEQVEQLLETMPDGILVVNLAGVVRYVNRAALELFGRTRQDFVGELLGFSIPNGESVEIRILRRGQERIGEMRVVEFEWRGEAAFLASIRDVTARKHGEEPVTERMPDRGVP